MLQKAILKWNCHSFQELHPLRFNNGFALDSHGEESLQNPRSSAKLDTPTPMAASIVRNCKNVQHPNICHFEHRYIKTTRWQQNSLNTSVRKYFFSNGTIQFSSKIYSISTILTCGEAWQNYWISIIFASGVPL